LTALLATVLEFDSLDITEAEAELTDEAEKDPGVAGVEALVGLCPVSERKGECRVWCNGRVWRNCRVLCGCSGVKGMDVIFQKG